MKWDEGGRIGKRKKNGRLYYWRMDSRMEGNSFGDQIINGIMWAAI